MSIQSTVTSLLQNRGRDGILHECRQCGTGVDRETTTCPVCDSTEIASYDVR